MPIFWAQTMCLTDIIWAAKDGFDSVRNTGYASHATDQNGLGCVSRPRSAFLMLVEGGGDGHLSPIPVSYAYALVVIV